MNTQEIKEAVRAGKTVYWKNPGYQVIHDDAAGWLIYCNINDSYVGLYGMRGLNGEEGDFYIPTKEAE